ncbi:3-deoxy-D-manno-octulosonic acid transferase [Rubritalea halochordaticola]|uniref:3-deoxy-D-manno-octulosonic acid transferase n=1 Tax=Rubritalea halochordaticola TaxID=714537 RepID=A0ABP9UXX5_9BACT
MIGAAVLLLYNLLLPLVFLLGFPGWLIKMLKRGGYGTGLLERFAWYDESVEYEPAGVVYVHAVSVGEVMIALKLIHQWQADYPQDRFVLAPTTTTGLLVAKEKAPVGVRVVYSPLDFRWVLQRVFKRFEPKQIVLIEAEAWPNMLGVAKRMGVPVGLANARLSSRSERRYKKFSGFVEPMFGMIDQACVQERADLNRWASVGIRRDRIEVTGSIKFDQLGAAGPQRRGEFQRMLDVFGEGRKVVMAISTHAGEEAYIGGVVQNLGEEVLYVAVPRHAERRQEVARSLKSLGYEVVLRSAFHGPRESDEACLIVDSTGELRDWTAHADVVVVGKSLLGEGGQNPTEAIAAGVPVVAGPSMGNFEPLVSMLRDAGGIAIVRDEGELLSALRRCLEGGVEVAKQCGAALEVLHVHQGAAARTVEILRKD